MAKVLYNQNPDNPGITTMNDDGTSTFVQRPRGWVPDASTVKAANSPSVITSTAASQSLNNVKTGVFGVAIPMTIETNAAIKSSAIQINPVSLT